MVLYGVVPECHRSVSGMVSECIMSAKMVSLSASGTVKQQTDIQCQRNFAIIFFHTNILSQKIENCIKIEKCHLKPKFTRLKSLCSSP